MRRFIVIISFAGFLAYGAWTGCADVAKGGRAAQIERAALLDSI